MRTALVKPSLLAFALAAVAGAALAQDCPSDPGTRASTQTSGVMPNLAVRNIVYIDPFADLLRMQAAMAREINAIDPMGAVWMPVVMMPPGEFAMPEQASALQRTKNGYELQVRVPGFKPEDIHVQLNGQLLRISAQESAKGTYKAANEPAQAFSTRSFVQTLTLPEPVEAAGLKQSVRNGVLSITIPSKSRALGST
ncbi:MAG TPA: Hsp20/alpha crystallin family protein [Thiobacillaceae bacterium]|nr:Hsp20/alpha crystallin family protein [Thiobacillaceae bacterium]